MLYARMVAAIDEVFPAEILAKFAKRLPQSTPAFRDRFNVLTAHGPYPTDLAAARGVRILRARRAAWEAYVDAAAATGVLDVDVISRFRGFDETGWRSAYSECLAVWLFAGKLGLEVTPRPPGRRAKNLDMLVKHRIGDLHVEVKAPRADVPASGVHTGDDADLLVDALKTANAQFEEGRANVLVVVPELRVELRADRYQLLRAFIGEHATTVDPPRRGDVGPAVVEEVFLPRGRFVRPRGPIRADGPGFTRVSAVLGVEEVLVNKAELRRRSALDQVVEAESRGDDRAVSAAIGEALSARWAPDTQMWLELSVLVVHNPFAKSPISEAIFERCPQLVVRGEEMRWTDEDDGA